MVSVMAIRNKLWEFEILRLGRNKFHFQWTVNNLVIQWKKLSLIGSISTLLVRYIIKPAFFSEHLFITIFVFSLVFNHEKHRTIEIIKKNQRRCTKFWPGVFFNSYVARLEQLQLKLLDERRITNVVLIFFIITYR